MEFVNSARESAAIDTLPIKLELFHRYINAFLTALTPAAVKHDLAECCRVIAVLMIGSTGGVGHNWGLKISKDGHQLISKPEPGPFFDGLEGADRLHCLVLEYGPMWQAVNFEIADKPGDSDPMHWAPGIAAIPSGFMLPDLNGNARLDLMWQVPSQWDVLSVTCFEEAAMGESSPEGPSMLPETVQLDGLSLLEGGLKLGQLLIFMLRAVLFEAALLAPALDLARGSDLTRHNTHQAAIYSSIHDSHSHSISTESSARQSLHPPPLTGLAMYRAVEARVIASLQPFLPGALMAPALITLHGRMQYLVEVGKGKGPKEAPSFSRSIPLPSAIKFMQKEVSLHALTHITAIARARDALAGVPAKEPAWRLTGALEYAAARAAASPELRLNIMEGAALRLQNAERIAIHNEINRLHLLTERVVAECCPSFSTHPLKAQEITEYLLHGVWSHDRIRDALAWRSMLMDQPELYPFRPAHEGHYLRRFHRPLPLHLNLLPPTASAKAFFELHYQNAVLQRAEAYVREAESAYNARRSGHEEEESVVKVKTSGSAMSEGKPGWLSSSPAWPSPEARVIEAALVIMKQALDMQGIQISLLRLSEDCDKLAGLTSSLSATSSIPTSNGLHTFITQCTPFSCLLSPTADSPQGGHAVQALRELSSLLAPENQSNAVQTVVSTAVSPAVQSLVRKLFNVRRRGNGNSASLSTDDAVFEFSSDELSRWMMEATAQITADARSALRSMGSAMVWERKAVHDFCGTLQATVADLGTDVESFMRRQAIKIETQVVDRAMLLLSELHEMRRTCSRYQEDSRRSLELSYIEAQKQWGDKMDEVKNALLVSQTNCIAMKADMYKSALEALLEVRREALNKAFGVDDVQREAGAEIMRMMQVESQLEAVQAEVLDMQRAMVKVQTWFKMRSNAFQTACMREVLRARDKVQGMEAAMWEERERSELAIEQLSSQLAATQADLEVANASLAKSTTDLVHARASNKKLMAWRVSELPRTEALRIQLAEARSSREAASKAGYAVASERFRMLERHQKLTLTLVTSKVGNSGGSSPRQSRRTDSPGSKKAAAPGRDEELPVHNARRDGLGSNQDLDQQSSGMLLLEHCELPIEEGLNDGGGSQRMPTAFKIMAMQQAWDVQRGELRSQVEELRKELQEERSAKNELFERFMTGTAGTARGSAAAAAATAGWQSDQGLEGLPQASAERLDPQALSTPEIHGMVNSRSEGGTALAMQLDILGRRHAQLCRDTELVVEERDALRRVLVAVRLAAPELAAALGISKTVDSTGSTAAGGPNMMPPSLNQKFQAPKQLQHHSGQPVMPTESLSQTRVPDHAQTSPTSEEANGVNSRLPSSTMQGHGGSTVKVPLRTTNISLTPGTVNASQLALQTPATRPASDTYAPAGGLSVPLSTAEAPTHHNVRPTSARRPLSNDLKATDGGSAAASVAVSSRTSADNADTSGTAAKRKSQLEVVGSSTQSTPMLSPRRML
ncbi:hypothetical protein CEUSTIGMA_g2803.t1 [Chlamydomonas eustigma]|uniref:Uncharacterized protein n=1 Tax=Chlamydomonas eustigma TaxID=1157962 RepID=A0A250WXD7_9CHLO|nr:hypothetical protein CEUSTIGMA_g2803.t1 [Chlamydomonas eustigma]|eukprot:GAX75359.1 hypothetical protein CEUSTIGMA_g2803.t1 [Chlamydomonas eustigma]